MGGAVECGVGLDTKTSPRLAAIEKAQAELRQEYDVLEEHKRELEFLEKGGNPLDFKFGHATSISRQSTSFPDQQAEQYVVSEAKVSFALSASPHGDSIESSGSAGGSVGRETDISDSLLYFDVENSNPGGEANGKRTGKRGNGSLLELFSEGDGHNHAKEKEDSLIFHLGVKRRAYARRNRTRTSRDSHSNKAMMPSSVPYHRDGNRSIQEPRAENNGTSYVSDSKPASSNGKVISKAFPTDSKLDMESPTDSKLDMEFPTDCKLDMEVVGVHTCHASTDKKKGGIQKGEAEGNISETLHNMNSSNHRTNSPIEQVAKDEATSVDLHSVPLELSGNVKGISSFKRVNGSTIPDNDATDVIDDDLSKKNDEAGSMTEVLSVCDVETDTFHADKENRTTGNSNHENRGIVRNSESRSNGGSNESLVFQMTLDNKGASESTQPIGFEASDAATDELKSVSPNPNNSIIRIEHELELCDNRTDMSSEVRSLVNTDSLKPNGEIVSKPERKLNNLLGDSCHSSNQAGAITSSLVAPSCEPSTTEISKQGTSTTSGVQNCAANQLKLAKNAREDVILKEARIIEANLKRTSQLPTSCKSLEKRKKYHWDFVLEEMAWMANDFMQERFWKMAAAAHICHQIASSGRSMFEQEMIRRKQRSIARTLAKAVMHFWHSDDVFRTSGEATNGINGECNADMFKSCKVEGETEKNQSSRYMEVENTALRTANEGYAVRFSESDCSTLTHSVMAEAPTTPDRVNDAGILDKSGEGELSEESLFYTVPPGAMQLYRETVESQWLNYKKMVNPMNKEDSEVSPCSLPAGPRKNEYEEDEGETGSCILPGAFEGTMSSKFTLKKKKIFQQKCAAQSYNVGRDFSYESCLDGKRANRTLMFTGKRPLSTTSVGPIPTKRVRTAARQRVVSPFSGGASGSLQIANKTDVSSGDTSSFQDESSMHGGSQSQKNMEVESTADFEDQLPFDGSETSIKSKKNSKHSGYLMNLSDSGVLAVSGKVPIFDQKLQADPMIQHEQRDQVKKRLENQHYVSNGNIGIYGQHAAKKPKLLKQLIEPSQEAIMSGTGSMPSLVASQMRNMSDQNKFIRIIAYRGRKSTAMKGSARQLFQQLQGPIEEDTLKAHFEKIILIGQKLNSCRNQKDNREPKQMTPVHSSHFVALSQTCPNNLGGDVLSPLDLCDAISSSPDVLNLGHQGSQITSAAIPSYQAILPTCLSTSSANTMLPGASGSIVGSNLPSPSTSLNASARNKQRYCMPRAASLPADEQQKVHYAQMLSSRNVQQSSMSVPGTLPMGADRNAHMLPGGNCMGMMSGRMPMSRPGFQGIISPRMPMVSAGSMLAGGGHGVPNSVNVHSSAVSGPGNSMLRPHDTLQVPRPGQNTEDHRQVVMQDLQMQVSQGSGQALLHFNAMSAPFSTTGIPSSVQSYPAQQQQQPHQMPQQTHMLGSHQHPHVQGTNLASPLQQAYAIRLAKERQLQQRMMPQSQQPYPASTAMALVQSSSQIQQRTQSSSCSVPTSSQAQHSKHQMPRNPQASSGIPNQIMKQRQRQQAHQQQPRHQQQQKQLPQQQAKIVKGVGGGAMRMHQNLTVDPSQVGGISAASRNEVSEKHLMQQGQGFFSGSSGLNSPLPQSLNNHKLYSQPPSQSSKQIPPLPSHSDTSNQSALPVPSNHTLFAPQQPPIL